jgi:hypothetical protein
MPDEAPVISATRVSIGVTVSREDGRRVPFDGSPLCGPRLTQGQDATRSCHRDLHAKTGRDIDGRRSRLLDAHSVERHPRRDLFVMASHHVAQSTQADRVEVFCFKGQSTTISMRAFTGKGWQH